MAKEKKEVTTPVEHTVDNVVSLAEKKITAEDIMSNDVKEQLKKESDERTKRQMKARYLNAVQKRDMTLIDLRRRRSEDDVTKKALVLYSDLVDGLMGVDITPEFMQHHGLKDKKEGEIEFNGKKIKVKVGDHLSPSIDYVDYDVKKREVDTTIRKMNNEARELHDKEADKVRAAYGDYWNWNY